jgi:hypothetical protein
MLRKVIIIPTQATMSPAQRRAAGVAIDRRSGWVRTAVDTVLLEGVVSFMNELTDTVARNGL